MVASALSVPMRGSTGTPLSQAGATRTHPQAHAEWLTYPGLKVSALGDGGVVRLVLQEPSLPRPDPGAGTTPRPG